VREAANLEARLGRVEAKLETETKVTISAMLALERTVDQLSQRLAAEAVERKASDVRLQVRMEGAGRAMHCLQKMMARPDSGQIVGAMQCDADGTISIEQLAQSFASAGMTLDDAQLQAMMVMGDGDGDGRISLGEFIHLGDLR
jgi:hypothetical protein